MRSFVSRRGEARERRQECRGSAWFGAGRGLEQGRGSGSLQDWGAWGDCGAERPAATSGADKRKRGRCEDAGREQTKPYKCARRGERHCDDLSSGSQYGSSTRMRLLRARSRRATGGSRGQSRLASRRWCATAASATMSRPQYGDCGRTLEPVDACGSFLTSYKPRLGFHASRQNIPCRMTVR